MKLVYAKGEVPDVDSTADVDPPSSVTIRIWNNLANIKFKALYTCECSRVAGVLTRVFSFILALLSSVAAWRLWQQHQTVWALLIGAGQILMVAVPHIPFLKSEKEFLAMSYEFENLYLCYERLWYDVRDGTVDENTAKETISELRSKEVEIEKSGVHCPRIQKWIKRIEEDTQSVLKLDLV